ncbi:MAG: carboxypeptidase regulatory-like domain-containing protein [candidate division WOR-3 bacterium]
MEYGLVFALVSGLNSQCLSGTQRVVSADTRFLPTLTMIIPSLNINWKRYGEDSVGYIADTTYEGVSRLANELWIGMGFSWRYYETSVAAPLRNDLWNGKFGRDVNAHMSTSLGDIFINNKFSYPFSLFDFPGAGAILFRYSLPIAPGEWDPAEQATDTSSIGVTYKGGVWRLLGYGSNSSYWGALLTYVPLDLFAFTLNLGFGSNRNGDPTDNTFEWGFSLDIRTGNYEPFVEYYSTSFISDEYRRHGNAPAYWTIGLRTESHGGAGVFFGIDFWQRGREGCLDNIARPDFWLPSWTPDWSVWAGVSYAYTHKPKETKPATGIVWGTVFDKSTNQPAKALVSLPEAKINRQPTDEAGVFRIEGVPEGKVTLVVEAPGCDLYTESIIVAKDQITYKNVFLSPQAGSAGLPNKGVIAGKVVDKKTGEPLAATIEFVDLNLPATSTSPSTGLFRVPDVDVGLYTLSVKARGYKTSVEVVAVKPGEPVVKDIELIPEGQSSEAIAGDEKSKATAAAFVSMAQDKAKSGEYEEALRYLDIAGVWDPENPQVKDLYDRYKAEAGTYQTKKSLEKGIGFYNDGRYLDALVEFDKALKADPKSENARKWYDMAFNALLEQGTSTQASVSGYISQGVALYAEGDVDGAITMWNKALEIDPNNKAAKDYIAKAQGKKQGDAKDLVAEGKTLMSKGQYTAALSKFNQALKLEPGNAEAASGKEDAQAKIKQTARERLNEGKELYGLKKYDEAEAKLRAALKLDPSLSEANTYLSKIAEARSASTKPSISEDEINALYLKGVEAYVKEDYETAVYYWTKVLEVDPNHSKAKKNMARAKQKMGG